MTIPNACSTAASPLSSATPCPCAFNTPNRCRAPPRASTARWSSRNGRPSTLTLYAKLPPILQTAACSLEGWRIRKSRYDSDFQRLIAEYEARSRASADEVLALRDRRLADYLAGPAAATPFYRALLARLGPAPALAQLPVVRKEQIQLHPADFQSNPAPRRGLITAHTSGTIGAGLRFHTTIAAVREQWAVWWRYRRWHAIGFDTWCGYFGGRSVVPVSSEHPPFCRVNYAGRQLMFSAYHLNEQNLAAYVDELRRRRPPWLHGYPSLLALVAAWLVDRGADLGYNVRWVTTGAENLMPQQRRLLERAFGVTPRQHYGMAEAVANFSECERGRLHVDEDFSFVEFLPIEATGVYRILGTNFTNPATPLVRYDTQDVARLSETGCTCGRPGRVVEDLDGRLEDYVVLSNGARLGRMDHILKDMTNIREAQIVQRTAGRFTYRIVRGDRYSTSDEHRLMEETRERVGSLAAVEIEYVDSIPRTSTGKLRFVVSTLPEGRLEEVGR
jgi:phenylacetate-CoA ligase